MKIKELFTLCLLLAAGAAAQVSAQIAVTVGSQVTDESNIVSGKAYILQSQAAGTGTLPYINDNGTNYDIPMSNACNESSVYYLISNGDGTWKIKNYYTNHFWGVPVYNQTIASVADEAFAGAWSLNFSNGIAYPSAPDAEKTIRGLDRSGNKLFGYTTGTGGTKQVKIYEVGPTEKGLTTPVSIVSGWYLVKWVDLNSDTNTNYSDADVNGKYIKNYAQDVTVNNNNYSLYLDEVPTGTDGIALSLIYFEKEGSESGRGVDGYLRSANGHYVTQTGAASHSKADKNFIIYRSSSTPNYSVITSGYTDATRYSLIPCGKDATPYIGQSAQNKFPVGQFYSVDFSLYGLQPWSVEFDGEEGAQVTYSGSNIYGLKSVYTGGTFFFANGVTPAASDFSAPKKLGFSPSISVDVENHQIVVSYELISQVYTLKNIAGNYITYDPSQSTTALWNTGKNGATALDTSNPNHQWVFIPTGTTGQFYLYNVGADLFAVPTGIAQSNSTPWVFSKNAVPISLLDQNDNTFKIRMAVDPVNGSNAAYMHVNNNYAAPVFNWDGDNSKFIITKVDDVDASAAANAAVAKLVKNQTALTGAVTADDGWYVISIKTTSNSTATASPGRYIYPGTTNQANYPLTFTGGVDVQPSISDATFFTRFVKNGSDYNWQMTDGRYLINRSNVFPTTSNEPAAVVPGYDNGCYIKSSGRFADPYVSNGNFFIGETSSYRTTWNIYPIDLSAAGLVAWQVLCDNAPESAQITCSRSDVCGLTSVYKNGFFFLPTDVTPVESDFTLDGSSEITIDGTAHTISLTYDPNLAIVADGVIVEQGWQTAGRDSEVMLLKVTAKPFKDATNTTLTVSLKDGSEANISTLKLYEANNNSPEIYSTGDGAPTKTEVATATVSGSTATFTIGNLTAGTHYYWIGATVSSTATLGAVLDAAVTGIAYQVEGQTAQNLDLTSVGDPVDRGAMVFNVRSYPFLPRDNGSRVYRIPAMIVAEDGSIVVAADKRYDRYDDIGNSHVIDIVVRRSTDGGKTWSAPVVIAKGENTTANGGADSRCGFGDPSLVKGKDGKLYCLFAAGNEGYFKGQKGMCMSVSTDNGVTWSSGEGNPPIDLYRSGAIKNVSTVGEAGFGLYDYFVTSGRGLYIPEDDILMYLIPAQTMTSATEHTGDSQDYIFYSRDGGESWYFSETPLVQGGDEAKIIQMNDGSLFGSIRKQNPRRFNTATYTKNDDGKTLSFNFGTQWDNNQLSQTHQNNQDIFYYQRETTEGKTDVIIHSITTGNHVNFKLFYSTDQGRNWTEFLNVQTKGTRYVTMDKNPANGSLYLFFEDQSLNSAGGYTDYNHYPLNFIEITRDQLVSLIPALDEYNVPEYLEAKDVKIVNGLSGETTYGSWSDLTWTSNAASGVAGLTMTLSDGTHDKFSNFNSRYNLSYHPTAANTNSTLTLTAPAGYVITGYSVQTGVYDVATYTLTAEGGSPITPASLGSTYTPLEVSGLSAASTTITITTTDVSQWLSLANFSVSLAKTLPLNVVGNKSYATLYLPFDVTTTGATKAYYVETASNGSAQLTATGSEGTEIPANTAVVLVNENADANTTLTMTTGLSSVVEESANLLKGTLVPMSLDLSENTPNYSLGKYDGNIGFYKFNNGTTTITLGANKAYLQVPAANGVKGFALSFGGEDGLHERVYGQTVNSKWYDLSGRRVSTPNKGVYIVNGKKVIR